MNQQNVYSISGSISSASEHKLEVAIGRQVRTFRKKLDLTVSGLAKLAGVSNGMLSKIENGIASPSLATIQSLATALQVPVTAFFRKYEEERDEMFVAQAHNFLDAIEGKCRIACTLEEAEQTLRVCVAALESGEKGVVMRIV